MKANRFHLLLAVICSQLIPTNAVIPSTPVDLNLCSINIFGQMKTALTISTAAGSTQFCFTDQTECIKISGTTEDTATSMFGVVDSDLEESVKAELPQIKDNATCFLKSDLLSSGQLTRSITFMRFGPQTVMSVTLTSNSEPFVQINALEAKEVSFTKSGVEDTKYIDLSGCRSEGEILLPGSDRPSTLGDCPISSCNSQGELITKQACGSLETCIANTCKATHRVCTVTSGQVIHFFGQVSSVTDRCLYSLLEPGDNSFVLLAAFEDRRSQILTFLDRLDLVLPTSNDKISLESSGRVRLNGQIQTLSTDATEVLNGVLLSKDPTGVNLVISNSDVSIFFDGSTAYIKVPDRAALQGLCGDATDPAFSPRPVSDSRSNQGCEIMPRVDNLFVNSAVGLERCSLLASEKFAECHDKVPVKPYIQACNLTLSDYPMVDNLNCQFFQAYAQVCKMQYDIDIEGWRSSFGCQKESYCQDHECNGNEFCGESKFKRTSCLCRAIYASEYHLKNTLGDPPTCQKGGGAISLIGCLLEEKGINYNLLHLNNENCTGQRDKDTHLVTFNFNSIDGCGTETEGNETLVVFKNSIVTGKPDINRLITRSNIKLDITCIYKTPNVTTLLLHVKSTSVARQYISQTGSYALVMQVYMNSERTELMKPNTELELNQQIWIQLSIDGIEENVVKLVTTSCWVTEQPAPSDPKRYDLIIEGCPNREDGTVEVQNNGLGKTNYFSFRMFQFVDNTSFYLHCSVDLCVKQQCQPTCSDISSRRRRSLRKKRSTDLYKGLISLEWIN
ncbi:alpha-tectorin-like [Stigmatopora argus]